MYCEQCGKDIKDNAKLCPYCGKDYSLQAESENIENKSVEQQTKIRKKKSKKSVIVWSLILIFSVLITVVSSWLTITRTIAINNQDIPRVKDVSNMHEQSKKEILEFTKKRKIKDISGDNDLQRKHILKKIQNQLEEEKNSFEEMNSFVFNDVMISTETYKNLKSDLGNWRKSMLKCGKEYQEYKKVIKEYDNKLKELDEQLSDLEGNQDEISRALAESTRTEISEIESEQWTYQNLWKSEKRAAVEIVPAVIKDKIDFNLNTISVFFKNYFNKLDSIKYERNRSFVILVCAFIASIIVSVLLVKTVKKQKKTQTTQ